MPHPPAKVTGERPRDTDTGTEHRQADRQRSSALADRSLAVPAHLVVRLHHVRSAAPIYRCAGYA